MAGNASSSLTLVFLIILIAAPTPSSLFFPTPYRIVSLGHSLMTRVANLRASRGDHSGAERARAVAATLERLELALGGMMWSTGWDYFRNYPWGRMMWSTGWDYFRNYPWGEMKWSTGWDYLRNYPWGEMKWSTGWDYFRNYPWGEMKGAVPEMKELMRWMTELSRMESGAERAAWVVRNYQSVLTVSNSMLGKLLQEFRQSGALREVVETLKKEVTEGELLRDCLELVSNDWKGLIQVLNDHLSQSSSDSTSASGHTAEL